RVHRIGKPSAGPANGIRQRFNTAPGAHKYVIETSKAMNPIFAQGYPRSPNLRNPASRASAMVLPSVNSANIKKIMFHLAHYQEQIVFLCEPNLVQSRIREYQLFGDVPK